MIRLLLDQGVPHGTARLLNGCGIETIHVGDLGLHEAADEEILTQARLLGRVVCTFDGDFHALMALSGATSPGVIFLRLQRLNSAGCASLLERVCGQFGKALTDGVLVTVTARGVRMHRLPVMRSSK